MEKQKVLSVDDSHFFIKITGSGSKRACFSQFTISYHTSILNQCFMKSIHLALYSRMKENYCFTTSQLVNMNITVMQRHVGFGIYQNESEHYFMQANKQKPLLVYIIHG